MRPLLPSGTTPLDRRLKLRLAPEIVLTFLLVRWTMRRDHDVQRLAHAARRGHSPEPATCEQVMSGRVLGNAVVLLLRRLPGDTRCLARSLVLLRMLRRRRLHAVLVLGVRAAPSFGAHAWIELGGLTLLAPIEEGGERLVEL